MLLRTLECMYLFQLEFSFWGDIYTRVPWTANRSNESILKEITPGCSLEGLMLKLKLQNFGHLMRRADSLEKTLMLWKIERRRRKGRQRMRRLNNITDSMDMNLSELRETGKHRKAWCAAIHWVPKSGTWFSNWITTRKTTGKKPIFCNNFKYIIIYKNIELLSCTSKTNIWL